MIRLRPTAAAALPGLAALVMVIGAVLLSTRFLVEDRKGLSERRGALMAASAVLCRFDLHAAEAISGGGYRTDHAGYPVRTTLRNLSETASEVTVTAELPSGGRVNLVRRLYHGIEYEHMNEGVEH